MEHRQWIGSKPPRVSTSHLVSASAQVAVAEARRASDPHKRPRHPQLSTWFALKYLAVSGGFYHCRLSQRTLPVHVKEEILLQDILLQ